MIKLEHRNDKIIPQEKFVIRMGNYALVSLAIIIFSLAIDILGYHYIADLMWIDSLHMSSMILTGMGPVAKMETNDAKVFSSMYALYSGIAFLSITVSAFAPIIHRILHILHAD